MKRSPTLSTAFSFLAFLFFLTNINAQDCPITTAETDIEPNNVRARLRVGGDLWWNGNDGGYIVPKPVQGEAPVSAFFVGGIWLAGVDPGGGLKLAAQTYGANSSSGTTDYSAGPLSEVGTTDETNCANYDRFWTTTADDIDLHVADFQDNGVIDGPVPPSIAAWPGRGNPDFESIHGFTLPDNVQGMAPFFDQNANGIYEPNQGDVPEIKGATEGTWWVFNDAGNIHTESGGEALQMEIQVLAYSYSSTVEEINNATFYDYKIINRAIEAIDSQYMSVWIDPDLGCYLDDYIGCSPEKNMGFVYNQDALDGDSSCSDCNGVNTYCEDIPVVGIKILKGLWSPKIFDENNELVNAPIGAAADTLVDAGMSSFMYYSNGGMQPPPPPGTADPNTATELYNYMSGSWRDGTRLTNSGDGYNPGSTDFTNYAFPGNPASEDEWSMCSENMINGDRRIVVSSGPSRMDPGAVNTLSFAVITVLDVPHPCPDMSVLEDAGDVIQNFFEQGVILSNEEILLASAVNIRLLPNPMTETAELVLDQVAGKVKQVDIFTIDGRLVQRYANIEGQSLTIDRGDMNSGMYLYKVVTENFKSYSGKFIVQ